MVHLNITDRAGVEHVVEAQTGLSLMEAIREAGFDDLMALCGGCCSCATCHVYVDDGDGAFKAVSEDENDLLDSSDHRQANSRLSCQLVLTAAADGLRATIAPED
ncbi:2Fe-2S iron-sulfur cluster-binding protein [Sphingobium sp.]|uniref:2Fe-2S iron-sulfur cluster-binding protein n=1 Tax=Sphingobium sp. TaxID=1912891 RepID=UPI0026096CF3|nr:2Fe-2S iron-sulfur cluster-binding protein [Sphingobium sp.]